VLIPPRHLCTDNAAMGAIAWERLERGEDDGLDLDVRPGTDRSAGYGSAGAGVRRGPAAGRG
jgi:tRNA A37 threonylcarbamoyltransferase TsaD